MRSKNQDPHFWSVEDWLTNLEIRELQRNTDGDAEPVFLYWILASADLRPSLALRSIPLGAGVIRTSSPAEAAAEGMSQYVNALDKIGAEVPDRQTVWVRDGKETVTEHQMGITEEFSSLEEALKAVDRSQFDGTAASWRPVKAPVTGQDMEADKAPLVLGVMRPSTPDEKDPSDPNKKEKEWN